MSINYIRQILLFAWQSFWRNIWLSIATITIIILAFVSINFLIILNIVSDASIDLVTEKIDVSIHFRQEVTEPQILEVKTYLSSLAQVKSIDYTSQIEALQKFRQKHQSETLIIESLEELDENPLGATLIVKAKDIADYPEILNVLDNSKYNELILDKNFEDHKIFINKIKVFSDNINWIGFLVSGLFVLIALLIVFNTIRMAIYTHREEIGIMKLVGATNWFIRSPFLLESIFYGVIACALALVLIYPLLNFIQPYLNNFFLIDDFDILEPFKQKLWQIFALELLTIVFLNIISSTIAIRRYLKV